MDPSSPAEDKLRTRDSPGIRHLPLRRPALFEPELEQRLGEDIGRFVSTPTEIGEALLGAVWIVGQGGRRLFAHGELKTRAASSRWDAHGPHRIANVAKSLQRLKIALRPLDD